MEKLTKKEYDICAKINECIIEMPAKIESQRNDIIEFIKSNCKNQKVEIQLLKTDETQYTYEFKLNDKSNYIIFDRFGREPVTLIPSGIFEPTLPN